MIKVEPINRKAHLVREDKVLLLSRYFRGHPLLHLGLAHDRVAVELVATAYEHVERLLRVLLQQVDPDRVVPTLEPWPTEVVRVHTRTEAITLTARCAKSRAMRPNLGTYRVRRPAHVLAAAWYEELHLLALVNTV